MNCSTLGFPVLHYLSEFAQTHAYWVSETMQQFYPLLSPSLLALSLFLHQGLSQRVGSSPQMCPRDSQQPSPTPQFESINSLALSLLYWPTLTPVLDYWKNNSFDYTNLCRQSAISLSLFFLFDTWSWVILCCGGCPARGRRFSMQDAK